MDNLVLIKLGGSLITDKTIPYTPRLQILADLAGQIAHVRKSLPGLSMILGHGSGSFGHTAAREYGTRQGLQALVDTSRYWGGFAEVWYQASALNRLVMEALHTAGLSAVSLVPVSSVTASDGRVEHWDLAPIQAALSAGLLPVVYGDVIFDQKRGGTILSTEDLFEYLTLHFNPQQILLLGLESAVWADYPARKRRIEKITPLTFADIQGSLGASHGADVTGGMESKVRQMLKLVAAVPGLKVQIFSGEEAGSLQKALNGETPGTLLTAD